MRNFLKWILLKHFSQNCLSPAENKTVTLTIHIFFNEYKSKNIALCVTCWMSLSCLMRMIVSNAFIIFNMKNQNVKNWMRIYGDLMKFLLCGAHTTIFFASKNCHINVNIEVETEGEQFFHIFMPVNVFVIYHFHDFFFVSIWIELFSCVCEIAQHYLKRKLSMKNS